MKTLLQIMGILALGAATALLIPLAYEAWHQRAAFESNMRKVDALLLHAERTMKSTDEAVAEWNKASKAQTQQSTAVLTETTRTLAQVRESVGNTDASLRTLFGRSEEAIERQDQSLLATQEQLRQSLQQMTQATQQFQTTLTDADRVIADPQIPAALASLADSTKQLDGAAADVKLVADKFASDYTKPANRAWATIKAIIGLGGQAGAISLLHK